MTTKSCHELAATKRVLGWVNRQRSRLGLLPLKHLRGGHPNDPERCSVAASIATVKGSSAFISPDFDRCGIYEINRDAKTFEGNLPQYVSRFGMRFDDGEFPELVVGGRP